MKVKAFPRLTKLVSRNRFRGLKIGAVTAGLLATTAAMFTISFAHLQQLF